MRSGGVLCAAMCCGEIQGQEGVKKSAGLRGDSRDLCWQISAVGNFRDRKSTRLNSSHQIISYAVFCLKNRPRPPIPTLFPYTTLFRSHLRMVGRMWVELCFANEEWGSSMRGHVLWGNSGTGRCEKIGRASRRLAGPLLAD